MLRFLNQLDSLNASLTGSNPKPSIPLANAFGTSWDTLKTLVKFYIQLVKVPMMYFFSDCKTTYLTW